VDSEYEDNSFQEKFEKKTVKTLHIGAIKNAALSKTEKNNKKKYASSTERFFGEVFAHELLSPAGRFSVIAVYAVLCVASIWGVMNVEVDFKVEYFIKEGTYAYNYLTTQAKYFETGGRTTIYVENDLLDYSSKETQLQLTVFNDRMQRCFGCSESWFAKNGLDSWFDKFKKWVDSGDCFMVPEGLPFDAKDYVKP